MSNSSTINVYEVSDNGRILLINPDEGFGSDAEAEMFAFALAGCDGNPATRYLVVEGTLLAAFPATGGLGEQEPDGDDLSLEPDAA